VSERPTRTTVLAEVALVGVTLATTLGYARLFEDASFVAPILLAALVAHGLAILLRRVGLGPALSLLSSLAALPLYVTWTRYGETTRWLLPTEATVDRLVEEVRAAWDIFVDISAPVPVAPGFVVVAMAAMWLGATVADALAFRAGATIEALAPACGLFVFASILSGPDHRIVSTAAFVASALAFVLAARVARADVASRWQATDATPGARSLLTVGGGLLCVAVLAAVLTGPSLPGADGDPIIDLDGDGGGDDRITLSPLVDIRTRLVEQSTAEVFTVESALPAYWRLTALDQFDGNLWSSSGSYVEAEGRLPDARDPDVGEAVVEQSFEIAGLAQIWLPAAFEAIAVDSNDTAVRWDRSTSTLVVDDDRETSDGLRYDVLSALPDIDPDDLGTGIAGLDREFLQELTELPATVQEVAERYAVAATRPGATPYEQALDLQDFLRGEFTYSTDVPPGHGASDLAEFLDDDGPREGYCEQFAGAYAALARALGLPARVAVGFTPGEEDEDEPGTYVVQGRHAHAWPEVYFAGAGWVPFEPTPGRGAPGAEAYTGVAPAQATPDDPVTPTTVAAPSTTGQVQRPTGQLEDLIPDETAGNPEHEGPDILTWLGRLVVVLLGLWLIGVPLVGAVLRWRQRRRARHHPRLEVVGAWDDATRALAVLDVRPRPAETPSEFAARASGSVGTDRLAHQALADLVTTATYAPDGTDASSVATARRAAAVIVSRARRLAGPWRRLRTAVSPRAQLTRR
jgi:transglutaminase-like putative cysteine protease